MEKIIITLMIVDQQIDEELKDVNTASSELSYYLTKSGVKNNLDIHCLLNIHYKISIKTQTKRSK